MSLPRFYVIPAMLREGEVALSPEEARHATGARRLGEGDAVELFDGAGRRGEGVLRRVGKKETTVKVTRIVTDAPSNGILEICTAVPKGKRWQMVIEKCTELGADVIQPMTCGRSVVKPDGNRGKWDRWALEACKQAGRSRMPEIPEPVTFADCLAGADLLLVADPDGRDIQSLLSVPAPGCVRVLVGPEGGFTEEELASIRDAGGTGLWLGPHILRVETAAVAASAVMELFRRIHG